MSASVKVTDDKDQIVVDLTHSLDKTMYDLPLTLKTHIPSGWKNVQAKQGIDKDIVTSKDAKGSYILYQASPNTTAIEYRGNNSNSY